MSRRAIGPPVADFMSTPVRARPRDHVGDAEDLAIAGDASHVLVCEEGDVIGSFALWDLQGLDRQGPVSSCMSVTALVLGPGDSVHRAAQIMRDEDVGCVPVMVDGLVVGVVTRADLSGSGVERDELEHAWQGGEMGGRG